jgi:hypothetical protein
MSILEDNLIRFRNRLVRCQWNTHGRLVADRNLDHGCAFLPSGADCGPDHAIDLGEGHTAPRAGVLAATVAASITVFINSLAFSTAGRPD